MSMSNLNGFISDEVDEQHSAIFTETRPASGFIKERLPNDGDRLMFTSEATGEWLDLVNKGGRLWIEVGEGAA